MFDADVHTAHMLALSQALRSSMQEMRIHSPSRIKPRSRQQLTVQKLLPLHLPHPSSYSFFSCSGTKAKTLWRFASRASAVPRVPEAFFDARVAFFDFGAFVFSFMDFFRPLDGFSSKRPADVPAETALGALPSDVAFFFSFWAFFRA